MYPLLPDRLDTLLLGEGFLPAILATAGAFDPPELASFVPFLASDLHVMPQPHSGKTKGSSYERR